MYGQEIQWSSTRGDADPNRIMIRDNTTRSYCIRVNEPLYDKVIYVTVAPDFGDALGTEAPLTNPWAVTSDCNDRMFLNTSSIIVKSWRCERCPEGGDCRGDRRFSDVNARFGFYRLDYTDIDTDPGIMHYFWPCLSPDACYGSPYAKYEGRFFEDMPLGMTYSTNMVEISKIDSRMWASAEASAIDLSLLHVETERCNKHRGFTSYCPRSPTGRCRLCRACIPKYADPAEQDTFSKDLQSASFALQHS